MNIQRGGITFQDAGGKLETKLDYKTNACKELFEESCCSLFIDKELLNENDSLTISNRYKTYFIHLDTDIEQFRS